MARLSNKELYSLIEEAYAAWHAEQEQQKRRFPAVAVPLNLASIWPHKLAGDPIAQQLNAKPLSAEEIRRKLRWRMQQVQYPYPGSSRKKSSETIYQVVRKRGLIDALLDSKLIEQVRLSWYLDRYFYLERHFRGAKQSHHGYSLTFHRNAMKEIASHLLTLDEMASQNQVPQEWLSEYRPAILRALLKEALICYPGIPRMVMRRKSARFESAAEMTPAKLAGDRQMEIYQALVAAMPDRSALSDNLAYHLTAVICSPLSAIRRKALEPQPSAVSRNVRDRLR